MKSFKKGDWDKFENLPEEYEKIVVFKNYYYSRKLAIEAANKNAFAFSGMYVRIYLKNFPENRLNEFTNDKPMVY